MSAEELLNVVDQGGSARHAGRPKVGRVLLSNEKGGTRPTIPPAAEMWEASYMSAVEPSPLQEALARAISMSGKARDHFDTLYRQRSGKSGKPIYDIMRGESRRPQPETLRLIAEVMEMDRERLVRIVYGQRFIDEGVESSEPRPAMVGIQRIDLAYGMGATFADEPEEIEVLDFPKTWIETITPSPPAMLTWSRGRGDSMVPTIGDGDMVLLDRSQKRVVEQDAIWAFTIGDLGSIKRLRIKGNKVVILSDNPAVPPDEENIDLVNIVARVVFIGRRT